MVISTGSGTDTNYDGDYHELCEAMKNDLAGEKIVIVEGRATRGLRRLISDRGLLVHECSSGEECLAYCSAELPGVVLLDCERPAMDALETCARLRACHGKTELPIILVAGASLNVQFDRGLAAGANDCISTSAETPLLLARIENQLALARLQRKAHALERLMKRQIKLETLAIFAAGIAHNFNNIFGSILGASELLRRLVQNDSKSTRCLAIIDDAVQSGKSITGKIGGLVKRGRRLDGESFEALEDVVAAVVSVFREISQERVAFDVQFESGLPRVAMNSLNFLDVVANIVSNAVAAIPARGTIRIRAHRAAAGVVLSVRDDGVGMDDAAREHAFEPFFTSKNLDPEGRVSIEGNGLGLWNVYMVVTMHGGEVSLASAAGEGTEVTVTLPSAEEPART